MENCKEGRLFVVSTPIGNLADITLRALETLKAVDLIAAEDTRHTRGLLAHFDIHTPLTSFHAFNEHGKCDALLDRVELGEKIALVCDAGTPGIADPGFLLVREAGKRQLAVEIVPGVSALTFAATASALPIDRFSFRGFPPVKSGRRKKFFDEISQSPETVFFYESPYRINGALTELFRACGPERPVSIIREATKLHEEVITLPVGELLQKTATRTWKGEFVIGVGPGIPTTDKNPAQEENKQSRE